MARLWLLALTACGRIGFDGPEATGDAASDDDAPGDVTFDAPPGSVTVTFGDRPNAMVQNTGEDTYLSNETGEAGFNFGEDDEVRLEADAQERALFVFDIQAIPTTATVLNAALTLETIQLPASPGAIRIHAISEAWQEGSSAGTAGVANWTFRQPLIPWSLPGASPPASASAALGSFTPTALGPITISLPTPRVQTWVTTPTTNFGVLLVSTSNESTRFVASESSMVTVRPLLTITYQL